jgi:hypothetical protein
MESSRINTEIKHYTQQHLPVMRADNKAFAKAVAPRKTIVFALQKSVNIVSLLVAFR